MADRRGGLSVDRERTCPFLLKTLVRTSPATERDFRPAPASSQLNFLYCWKDSTLRELVLLLRDSTPSLRLPLAKYAFRLAFYDERSDRYLFRDMGVVHARDLSSHSGMGDKTLDECRFVVGDYVEVVWSANATGGPSMGSHGARDRDLPIGRPLGGLGVGRGRGDGGWNRGGFGGFSGRGAPTGKWGRGDGDNGGFRRQDPPPRRNVGSPPPNRRRSRSPPRRRDRSESPRRR